MQFGQAARSGVSRCKSFLGRLLTVHRMAGHTAGPADKWDSLPQLPELKRSYIDALKAPNLTQVQQWLAWGGGCMAASSKQLVCTWEALVVL